jgi:transposase InsO family protein
MAYSNNPNLPKARAMAMKMLIRDRLPLQLVANKCGVHRSTIYRWKQKWDSLNQNIQLTNDYRPSGAYAKPYPSSFRLGGCLWRIATESAAPHTSPHAISQQVIDLVLQLRHTLKRCAEVIWHHLVNLLGIKVSLSSVHRILRRHHEYNGSRKNRVRPDNPHRPIVTKPGELVQTDTIHYVDLITKKRRYVYTVIDLYSRMAYAEVHSHIRPGIAASVIVRASKTFGFNFNIVQADNGPEFSHYFSQVLARSNTRTRHSRLGRPNDNAHIERFNRTIQEECLGNYIAYKVPGSKIQEKINNYLDYYNNERVHLGIQLHTPSQMLQRS